MDNKQTLITTLKERWNKVKISQNPQEIAAFNQLLSKHKNIGLEDLEIPMEEWKKITHYKPLNDLVYGA